MAEHGSPPVEMIAAVCSHAWRPAGPALSEHPGHLLLRCTSGSEPHGLPCVARRPQATRRARTRRAHTPHNRMSTEPGSVNCAAACCAQAFGDLQGLHTARKGDAGVVVAAYHDLRAALSAQGTLQGTLVGASVIDVQFAHATRSASGQPTNQVRRRTGGAQPRASFAPPCSPPQPGATGAARFPAPGRSQRPRAAHIKQPCVLCRWRALCHAAGPRGGLQPGPWRAGRATRAPLLQVRRRCCLGAHNSLAPGLPSVRLGGVNHACFLSFVLSLSFFFSGLATSRASRRRPTGRRKSSSRSSTCGTRRRRRARWAARRPRTRTRSSSSTWASTWRPRSSSSSSWARCR